MACSSFPAGEKAGPTGTAPTGFAIEGMVQRVVLRMDAYRAAMAFVKGKIAVRGDLFAASRFFGSHNRPGWHAWRSMAAAWRGRLRFSARLENRLAAARDIRFHYDRSNAFYQQFLDSRMQYSAGHFSGPECTLEEAQLAKLERICRHLDLARGQRFLDIGCGWGGLLVYAAAKFGVEGVGCTLSDQQAELASETVRERGVAERVEIRKIDYRDLTGQFDRITSVGMFEHVGGRRIRGYFRKVHSLLAAGGRFLNRGIVRPQTASDRPETLFIQRHVFPGGELIHLSDLVRDAERAGFEMISMEDAREHYARTCRAWVANLQANADTCRRLVDEVTYRTWLLYLAASAVNFEDGQIDCVEVMFRKR
jgi:cyclopropane-fatty-acyl-phospholipid synthase